MPRRTRKKTSSTETLSLWPANTELVRLTFQLIPQTDSSILPKYPVALHAWFLNQVRAIDPELSAYLHDGESEKPFTISRLEGNLETSGKQILLRSDDTYHWHISALSSRVVECMERWLSESPDLVDLHQVPLTIASWKVAESATYDELFQAEPSASLTLHFATPTSFRRKGHHLPLPWPPNVFHSYLRRWNDFSGMPFDQDEFLTWVEQSVIIIRHELRSTKVSAGKKGAVTGFTGAVEFGLTKEAQQQPQFVRLYSALGRLAPYCGTGHKTTFGLGQTRRGWLPDAEPDTPPEPESQLAQRIEHLTEMLMGMQKRTGGQRAIEVCQTRATILARQEFGESLQAIALDLEMPYETVKTYAKLARRVLKSQ